MEGARLDPLRDVSPEVALDHRDRGGFPEVAAAVDDAVAHELERCIRVAAHRMPLVVGDRLVGRLADDDPRHRTADEDAERLGALDDIEVVRNGYRKRLRRRARWEGDL